MTDSTGTDLALRDPYALLDAEDERTLLAEMAGRVVKTYVYEVETWDPKAKRKVKAHQLSKPGVDAVCRELSGKGEVIRELEMEHVVDRQEQEAYFRCRAGRYRIDEHGETLLDTAFGVKRQPMVVKLRDGRTIENQHWYEHGAMKAARNARRRLIPETLAVELIRRWATEEGRVERVQYEDREPVSAAPASAPADPAPSVDRDTALQHVARELDAAFGEGDPSTDEQKKAVLRRVFRTSDWTSLKRMPPSRFASMYSEKAVSDAVAWVSGGAE